MFNQTAVTILRQPQWGSGTIEVTTPGGKQALHAFALKHNFNTVTSNK